MDENRERVLDFIRTSEQAVSIRELTDALELSESCVFNKLRRLTMALLLFIRLQTLKMIMVQRFAKMRTTRRITW